MRFSYSFWNLFHFTTRACAWGSVFWRTVPALKYALHLLNRCISSIISSMSIGDLSGDCSFIWRLRSRAHAFFYYLHFQFVTCLFTYLHFQFVTCRNHTRNGLNNRDWRQTRHFFTYRHFQFVTCRNHTKNGLNNRDWRQTRALRFNWHWCSILCAKNAVPYCVRLCKQRLMTVILDLRKIIGWKGWQQMKLRNLSGLIYGITGKWTRTEMIQNNQVFKTYWST